MKHLYLFLLASLLIAVAKHAEAQKTSLKYITPTGREVPAEQAHFLIVQEENAQGGGIRTRFLIEDSVKVSLTSYSDMNGGRYGQGVKHGVHLE